MATTVELAALSAFVYNNERGARDGTTNTVPLPPGWIQLAPENGFTAQNIYDANLFSFTAGAFLNQATGEVVISYKGTDFLVEFAARAWNTVGDALADLAGGVGNYVANAQFAQAALYYEDVKKWVQAHSYSSDAISFTGHSLGGGIASVMSVWFNRPSTNFAEAPFEQTANSSQILPFVRYLFLVTDTSDADFDAFLLGWLSNPVINPVFTQRETLVNNLYNYGEFLDLLRQPGATIYNTSQPIGIAAQPVSSSVSLHSMNLHFVFLSEDRLRQATLTIPELLPSLISGPYAHDPNGGTRDFVTALAADQMRGDLTREGGLLGRFTSDVLRLGATDGLIAQPQVRTALIAAAQEYYMFNGAANTTQLFNVSDNAVHFDYSTSLAEHPRSPRMLAEALRFYLSNAEWEAVGLRLQTQTSWHMQSGAGGMTWTASGATVDVAVGAAGVDVFDAGAGDDILIGGAGRDFLTGGSGADYLLGGVDVDWLSGGTGNDRLYGGAGSDIYAFETTSNGAPVGFGNDVIVDEDGQGAITINGQSLPSAELFVSNVWRSASNTGFGQVTYTLSGSGASSTLTITFSGRSDSITIRGWQQGQFGLTLSGNATPPVPTRTLSGDLAPITVSGLYQIEYSSTGGGNLVTGGGPSIGFDDLLIGGTGNDLLQGWGGNNSLSGHEGDDHLVGGSGHELIAGGPGVDWIEGGDGTDIILGGGTFEGAQFTNPNQSAPPPVGVSEYWLGRTWAAGWQYYPDGSRILRVSYGSMFPNPVDDGGDVIDAGAGNDDVEGDYGDDIIDGGTGLDFIHGGPGNDTIRGGDDYDEIYGDSVDTPGVYAYVDPSIFGHDTIDGGGGDDFISGQGGNDALFAGDGADIVLGDLRELDPQWHGDDYLDGGSGSDRLLGEGGNDTLYGGDGDDQIQGDDQDASLPMARHGSDYLDGEAGADILLGGGLSDTLFGGSENDVMYGDDADNGNLQLQYMGSDYLDGQGGDDYMVGDGGADVLYGGIGNDRMWGDSTVRDLGTFGGQDRLDGGEGDDTLVGGYLGDVLYGGAGVDRLEGDGVAPVIAAGLHGNDLLDGGDGNDTLIGDGGSDWLYGGDGNDTLDGDRAGSDLSVQAGDDLHGGAGDDSIQGGGGADFLHGDQGADSLYGDYENATGGASDVLFGDAGNDLLYGGAGADSLYGGDGDDYMEGDSAGTSGGLQGGDELHGEAGNDTLIGQGGADLLEGGAGLDNLQGGEGNDYLDGGVDADTLSGGSGNDTLVGTDGADTLAGGAGDDFYDLGANTSVVTITELAGEGIDTLRTQAANVTLVANVENLILNGSGAQSGTGNALDNSLIGTASNNTLSGGDGNDSLDGRGGVDSLVGGNGNDSYTVYSTQDSIVEAANAGNDTVLASSTYTLASNLENLTLTGTGNADGTGNSADNRLTGNTANNRLTGLDGNDTLDGGAGTDTLIGGVGNDTYVVDSALDVVTELAGQGTDTVQSSVSYTLAVDLENLTLTGSGAINGTGNAVANALTGNGAANTLDGGAGADTMRGGAGDDTYIVDNATDAITEIASEGIDEVRSNIAWTLGTNIENLTLLGSAAIAGTGNALANRLLGNSAANTLTGNDGDDWLDGGAGTDSLVGGAGNDTYVLDVSGDTITETNSGGADTVLAGFTYTLGNTLENLTLTGTSAINGTGNGSDNILIGNGAANTLTGAAGNDTLDGGAGADRLVGGSGNDMYVVDATADVVVENTNDGTDTVRAFVDHTLSANTENLTLLGTAVNGTGNALANILTGNAANNVLTALAGNDTLDGGAGNDMLVGGTGNDTYVVDSTSDVVTELAAEGTDAVQSTADFTLGANVENLTLLGSAPRTGTGNDLANTIVAASGGGQLFGLGGNDTLTGGAGNDRLDGGTGNDTMSGGAGNDVFVIDSASDVASESADGGVDEIITTVSYVLGSVFENLTLSGSASINATGNASSNYIFGNSGNNVIDGGGGRDYMTGGAGDDVYYVDSLGVGLGPHYDDMVYESSGGGIDTAHVSDASVPGGAYWLPDNVERGILDVRVDGIGLVGNALANTLTGGTGDDNLTDVWYDVWQNEYGFNSDDVLDGGSGRDRMEGYLGNDTYYVDNAGDIVIERPSHVGFDTVVASVSWAASASDPNYASGIDRIVAAGTQAVNLTGDAGASELIGNAAANVLTGLLGTDTLDGGAGSDRLVGGGGADTYRYNQGGGLDTIVDTADGNVVRFGSGITVGTTAARSSVVTGTTRINVFFRDANGAEIAGQGLQFDLPADQSSPVSQFIFADGSTRTLSQLLGGQSLVATGASASDVAFGSDQFQAPEVLSEAVPLPPLLNAWRTAHLGIHWYLGRSSFADGVSEASTTTGVAGSWQSVIVAPSAAQDADEYWRGTGRTRRSWEAWL